ncbi:MAG TPA: hypothetical protein O0X27_05150 [Methanocorpusculum sp.]|nr:hypothetical protein [Methanocorpusculum sp.]
MTDELNAQILRELGEINAGQKHVMNDIADIKSEIREINERNQEIEDRVRRLETVQAECKGKNTVVVSAFNRLTALISGIVSAGVALIVALITSGRI